MAQLAVLIAGLLLTTASQASDVAEVNPSAVQGFLSKYMTSNVKHGKGPDALSHHNNLAEHGPAADEGTGPFMVIDDKPLPHGNNTPMTLYAVGAGLFALVMMLGVRIQRGLRPATVLASMEMKSHASSSINGAALGEGISNSQGFKAHSEYLREAELKYGLFSMLAALRLPVTTEASRSRSVSDEWDPLNLFPSDPTIGRQPALFAVDPNDKKLPWWASKADKEAAEQARIDAEQEALNERFRKESQSDFAFMSIFGVVTSLPVVYLIFLAFQVEPEEVGVGGIF
jgi:hypothetical protein